MENFIIGSNLQVWMTSMLYVLPDYRRFGVSSMMLSLQYEKLRELVKVHLKFFQFIFGLETICAKIVEASLVNFDTNHSLCYKLSPAFHIHRSNLHIPGK